MKVWLTRTITGCQAADDEAVKALKRLPVGVTFEADIVTRKTRSGAWHRRYWVLMTMLASNVEQVEIEPGAVWPIRSAEDVHAAMKYLTGLYDSYSLREGMVRVLRSTAFEKMDGDAWAAYWPLVLDAVHMHFLPQVSIASVENEIARLAS